MESIGKAHWFAIKGMLKYIHNSTKLGLLYIASGDDTISVKGYVDSDYAKDKDTIRPTSAYFWYMEAV